jgi:minor extracellular serine protease Vpr
MRLTQRIILTSLFVASAAFAPLAAAPPVSNRWIVILNEPSVIAKHPGRYEKTRAIAEPYRQHLLQVQANMRTQIEGMNIRVTGAVQHVLNALFVVATPAQAETLRHLPGVKAVAPMRQYRREDQLSISKVQAAWDAAGIGGESKAGLGLKIAIIDSGIDQSNPSFQDSSLTAPAGFPICDVQSNCNFTNNKVIVARSYVSSIVTSDETNPSDPAAQSRPDDVSARDLIGHGTAVASVAAGVPTTFNGIAVSGVAPKAYLGNYKIFGSNDVNPNGSANIIQAIDDAVTDGMNVINLSLGGPAYSGPLDTSCGGECDPLAFAIENVVQHSGIVVVAAAGNEGNTGYQYNIVSANNPTYATVGSPAYTPSAVAAGGVQNDVTYFQSVDVPGSGVPANVQRIAAVTSADGPVPASPFTAPAVDVTQAGDSDGLLCNPIGPSALVNEIALVLRGTCTFSQKVTNAQNAGALGVIFIDNGTGLSPWGVGANAIIPAFLVGQSDGQNLKSYVDSNRGAQVTMNPNPYQASASLGYVAEKCQPGSATPLTTALIPISVACFTSVGPVTGVGASVVKPDVSAAATDFLLAAEDYDPEGDLFSLTRYATADGTSFSTPMLAGAAALVMQANRNLSPLQVKSALVNTATTAGVMTTDGTAAATVSDVGSGLLQAQNAVASTVQVVPSSLSFGVVSGSLPAAQVLTIYNSGSSPVSLNLTVAEPAGLSGTQVLVNSSTSANVSIAAGFSTTISVSLSGSVPAPGRYEGLITSNGGPGPLSIPYLFLVSDNTPYDTVPLNATPPGYVGFDGPVNSTIPWYSTVDCTNVNSCVLDYGAIAVKVIDRYGAPVANAPVQWSVTQGNGSILQGSQYTDSTTDQNGVAGASVVLGSSSGYQEFTATVGNMAFPFDGYVRDVPSISPGIVDAASFTTGRAVAPGSWIAIYGSNLSDTLQGINGTDNAFDFCPECSVSSQPLPMGIDGAAFSFDASNLSLPGRFLYASPTQLNVQVPWELQGQTQATVKVMVNYTYSATYKLLMAEYSPGFFVIDYGTQEVAAQDASYNVVTSSNPVARGSVVQLFVNGLGPVNNQPADGLAGPPDASATTKVKPTVTIGGQTATIEYSGLAPGYVGLYQVNADVPQGIGTGMQPIIISIGGVTSKTAYLSVK